MNYESFVDYIFKNVENKLTEDCKVTLEKVTKNNGKILDAIVIAKNDVCIAPTIYLNHLYHNYLEGSSLESIVESIFNIYNENSDGARYETAFITNYDLAKERLVLKLINYEQNKKLLETVPHMQYLDLAIVFSYVFENPEREFSSILINDSLLSNWNVSKEDLYKQALINSPNILPHTYSSLLSTIKKMDTFDELPEFEEDECIIPDPSADCGQCMFVLTNTARINGAACIFYKGLLNEISNMHKTDLIIIPSSIHEVIIIPKIGELKRDFINKMIQDVNVTHLKDEDVLSDHAYLYSHSRRKIESI